MILPTVEELLSIQITSHLGQFFTKQLQRAAKRLQDMLFSLQKYDLVVQYERGDRMF